MHPPWPFLPLEQGLGGMRGAAAPRAQQMGSGRAQALAAPAAVLEHCCLWGREPVRAVRDRSWRNLLRFEYGLWV